jgi:hypothetical protein
VITSQARAEGRLVVSTTERTVKVEQRQVRGRLGEIPSLGVPSDRGQRRKLTVALGLLLLAVLIFGGQLGWWRLGHSRHLEESRQGLWRQLDTAEQLERDGQLLGAWQVYRSVEAQAGATLEAATQPDPELVELLDRVSRRVAELADLKLRPVGDGNAGSTAADGGPIAVSTDPVSQLVGRDRYRIYLDLRRQLPEATSTVAGLGVTPGESPRSFAILWGEPGWRRSMATGDHGTAELWAYRDRYGFDIIVHKDLKTGAARIDRIILEPMFAGSINGVPVKDWSRPRWEAEFGSPVEGSSPARWKYERPFVGTVTFTEAGELITAEIAFQQNY